jgi:hypothetical protein
LPAGIPTGKFGLQNDGGHLSQPAALAPSIAASSFGGEIGSEVRRSPTA